MSVSIIDAGKYLLISYSSGKYTYADKPFTVSKDETGQKVGIRSKFFADQIPYSDIVSPTSANIDDLILQLIGFGNETYSTAEIYSLIEQAQINGEINGKDAHVYNIIGRRTAFSSTSVFSDVGEGIGASSQNLFPSLTGAEIIQVLSSNANDTLAGTGARSIKLTYIDSNYALQTVSANMNGLTAVQVLASGCLQVLWWEVTATGSSETSVGNLTLRTSAPVTLSRISAGGNKSMDAIFMVPDGYTGYVYSWSGTAVQALQDMRLRAQVDTTTREFIGVYHFMDNKYVGSGGEFSKDIPVLKFPARCKIKISTISGSTSGNTRCDADYSILIIQD